MNYRFEWGWRYPAGSRWRAGSSIKRILAHVAEKHGFEPEALTGKSKVHRVSVARQEAMWLAYQERWPYGRRVYSLPQIGAFFGDRDHTTVLHAIRRHEARLMFRDAA